MAKGVPNRYPLPKDEKQYRIFLESVDESIGKEEYIETVMKATNLKHKYTEMITDNLIFYGFIYRKKVDEASYRLKSHSEEYLKGELKFSELCKKAISSIDQKHTSTIDFILDVLKKLPNKQKDSLTISQIYKSLDSINDPFGGYEFAKKGRYTLSEIIRLLKFSKYIKELDGKYWHKMSSSEIKKLRRQSRRYSCEEVLNTLGDDYSEISDEFKVALSKYHVYWHSNGKGKLRKLSSKLEPYLDGQIPGSLHQKVHANYKSRYPGSRMSKSAWETSKRYKAKLATTIRDKYKLEEASKLSTNLSWKTVTLLEKIVDGDFTFEEFKSFISKSENKRFNRSTLDDNSHHEGAFQFNSKIKPHQWQVDVIELWQKGSDIHKPYYGIISAVTGSGKTVAAMLAVNRFIQNNPKGIVSVIVPTKVLMKQWAEEFSKILGLGSNQIGICGDGFKDSFTDGKRVVISIINSAIRSDRLRTDLESTDSTYPHFLIADECHRYGGDKYAKVFDCRKDATLGLSATPPSEESKEENKEMNAVISALGKQFYKLSYRDAREQKLICQFVVKFVGVELDNKERIDYDNLSKKLSKALQKIRMLYGHRIESMSAVSLDQKLNMIINSDERPDKCIFDYFDITRKRRDLIYASTGRQEVFENLVKAAIKKERKIMLFHETVKQMEEIVSPLQSQKQHREGGVSSKQRKIYKEIEELFFDKDYKPVMYHSKNSPDWNNRSMEWYRSDVANVMLSVKALVEGVDVPAADLGIVRVSSSSVRQRIQTIGRVLRKGDYNKKAEIWIVFVEDTVDKNMFKSYKWQEELGQSQIEYCRWNGNDFEGRDITKLPVFEDYEKDMPPIEVDVSKLKIGDVYPGRLAGDQYGVDARSVPFKNTRNGRIPIKNKNIIVAAKHLHKIKGGGKIYLTPQGNFITKVKKDLIFLGSTDVIKFKEDLQNSLDVKKLIKKSKSLEDLFS